MISGGGPAIADPVDPNIKMLEGEAMPYIEADSLEEANLFFDQVEAAKSDGDSAELASLARGPKYAPCEIKPEGMHLRSSGAFKIVGFKVLTECTVPVRSIEHRASLRQYHLGVYRTVPNQGPVSKSRGGVKLYTKSIFHRCDKTSPSREWGGAVTGVVNWGGKEYYSRAYPKRSTSKIACYVP